MGLSMPNLRSLSLGRNVIKKIEKLDGLAGALEELWISYNLISSLDGVQALQKLTTLYMSNNAVKSWDELGKLQALPAMREVLFKNNPIYDDLEPDQQRIEVLKHL